jgi:2-polyprenyl-3-methyl-5-hydroxy-6-metoxy-1,4-benzoquinol methylase
METNLFEINKKPQGYYSDRGDMLKYVPDTVNTLLDVGCGEGLFGHTLKQKRNIVVWGVELFEKEANKAKDKLDRVLVGNIELNHLDLPNDYFDCVVFNDVLEHLQYPWIVLNKIKKYLKQGGYVIASIPNIRYYEIVKKLLLKKEWEYEDSGVMDKTHLRFFTI